MSDDPDFSWLVAGVRVVMHIGYRPPGEPQGGMVYGLPPVWVQAGQGAWIEGPKDLSPFAFRKVLEERLSGGDERTQAAMATVLRAMSSHIHMVELDQMLKKET